MFSSGSHVKDVYFPNDAIIGISATSDTFFFPFKRGGADR